MFACREEDYSLLDDLLLDLAAESAEVLQQVFTTYGQRPQLCFEHHGHHRFKPFISPCLRAVEDIHIMTGRRQEKGVKTASRLCGLFLIS